MRITVSKVERRKGAGIGPAYHVVIFASASHYARIALRLNDHWKKYLDRDLVGAILFVKGDPAKGYGLCSEDENDLHGVAGATGSGLEEVSPIPASPDRLLFFSGPSTSPR